MSVFCTVFTPAYNRRELMIRLFDSLCAQTDKDFEWVIVDDGSTDGTQEAVSNFEDGGFPIVYKKVENGGKHRAINHGLTLASGKVFAIVDSDDHLTPDAIEVIKAHFATIEGEERSFCGVATNRKNDATMEIVGTFGDGEYVDAKATERDKYGLSGDKFEIYYTEILKKYPFPEIEGEKFMTEAVVWNRLAADGYYIRWFNDAVYLGQYLEGGLTDSREACIEKSPKGYLLYIKELVEVAGLSLLQRWKYYSFYAKVRRRSVGLRVAAKELEVNVVPLWFFVTLRAILKR